ncbi:MAG TPA: sugar kinase [Acidimicrobium sp.]|jgi:glucokinase|nr:sugar kinase [Acidimicrobium sp.]
MLLRVESNLAKTSNSSGFLAIDIGGTKLAVGVVSRSGELLSQMQTPTPVNDVWGALKNLIDAQMLQTNVRLEACGVGCGGPMTLGGESVSPLNIADWRGFGLLSAVESATGLKTYIANDAQALVLGEVWCGSAVGVSDVIGMVVSTGVGGGIISNNKLLTGRLGNAGHIGHVIVEPDGRLCECGAYGCLEAHVSGKSIQAMTGKPSEHATNEVRIEAGKLVGRALVSVGALMDLQLCVIGGSVALGFGAPFFAAVQHEIDRSARLEFIRGLKVLPVGLGDSAPLIGAASLARTSY